MPQFGGASALCLFIWLRAIVSAPTWTKHGQINSWTTVELRIPIPSFQSVPTTMPVTRSKPAPDPPPITLTRLRVDREPSRKAREAGKFYSHDLFRARMLTTFSADADDVSHPVPDPVIGPRRRTPTGPTGPPGLLFKLSAPLTCYLLITYTSASAPTPGSACLRTPAPLRSIIPFILPPYLPDSCLPVCIRFLVPDFDSCPYSSDSDRTSYTDSLS